MPEREAFLNLQQNLQSELWLCSYGHVLPKTHVVVVVGRLPDGDRSENYQISFLLS